MSFVVCWRPLANPSPPCVPVFLQVTQYHKNVARQQQAYAAWLAKRRQENTQRLQVSFSAARVGARVGTQTATIGCLLTKSVQGPQGPGLLAGELASDGHQSLMCIRVAAVDQRC